METIHVAAVGDFLMHMPLLKAARDDNTGEYDFTPMFSYITGYLSEPDYTIGNLETRLAGKERGYHGYPRFNSPESMAGNLKTIGFDLITTSNNHSLDMGVEGIYKTIEHLEKANLDHIGTYRSQEERDSPFIRDIKGIRLGFLNYTQDTNGIPVPEDKTYLVNTIQRDQIKQDINELTKMKPDIIIACIHFGTEYERYPNEFQQSLVNELFEMGVDVVLGNHPHVVQPMEVVKVIRDDAEKDCFVIYSLGNFISNQRWRFSDSGIILNVYIEKDFKTGKTTLKKVDYIPIWVHTYHEHGRLDYRVLPVQQAIHEYNEGKNPTLTREDHIKLQQVWDDITAHLGSELVF